ncbi:low temperature requirement protein A [Micromonospora sp. NPDC049366]|uniref:low temperature requirement protein A n=1 Tax=Micromonospora sp. NPDC049366 TaxID=3364271 RepID=UPI0037B82F42
MRHRDSGRLVRGETSSERATFLELFLDLVFVFALTRISARLITDFTDDERHILADLGQSLLLFLALWAVWSLTVWSTSWLDPEAPVVQSIVVITVVGAMVMAVAVPEGFGDRAPLFALTYVALQIGRVVYFDVVARGRPDPRESVRVLFWRGLSAPLWVVGGFVDDPAIRGVLWSAGVLIDYAGPLLGWPTPWLGARRLVGHLLAAEHLAERYQQFLLIALGEAIFVTGLSFSGSDFQARQTAGFALALASTVLLWRIYFHRAGRMVAAAISRSRDAAWLATDMAFSHLIMVAGIVLSGVGFELFITEPVVDLPTPWLVALLGGPALFLTGRSVLEYLVFGRVSRSRVGGLLALGLLTPVALHLPPLAVGAATAAVLLAVAAADTRRAHGRPAETPAPPV